MYDLPKRETAKARLGFKDYWDLGPDRSLAKLALRYKEEGKTRVGIGRLERWSSAFGWQQRIIDRDDEIASAEFEREKVARAEMRELHISTARALLGMAHRAIRYLIEANLDQTLAPNLLPLYVKTAAELERLARGEPTTIEQIQGSRDRPLEIEVAENQMERVNELLTILGEAGIIPQIELPINAEAVEVHPSPADD